MTQNDYNRYCHWRSQQENMPFNMPFLAGGYTQADWDILNGELVDIEYLCDYCDTPDARHAYIERWTKPYWA